MRDPPDPANGQPDKNSQGAWVPEYVGTWVHGYMAGMGSTAKAVDAGVAGFNWNSPLVAHLARPGARITEAWLGKDGRTLACLESSNAPLSYSLPRLPFPGQHPTRHGAIHASSDGGNIYVPSQLLSEARLSDLQQMGGLLLASSSGRVEQVRVSFLQMQIDRS